MTVTEFAKSDGHSLRGALRARWLAGRGEWDQAHQVAQAEDDREAAWVHAYLRRAEGDTANAVYWYRRVGRPVQTGDLRAEWEAIVTNLLHQSDEIPASGDSRSG